MRHAINQFLPNDIIAKKSKLVSDSFHSTLNAKNKTYRYTILNNEFPTVFGQDFYYHVRQPLDIEKIIRASKLFVGKHDFSAFCSEAHKKNNCIRTITNIKIKKSKNFIYMDFSADGFLYNMIRIIVGTLIEAGQNKITPTHIKEIFKSKTRIHAGQTAPPQGLCLIKVIY